MLDIKMIREETERITAELRRREPNISLDKILDLDTKRRTLQQEIDSLKHEQKKASNDIASAKKQGQDASDILTKMGKISDRVKELDLENRQIEKDLYNEVALLPNLPHSTVPTSLNKADNQEVRSFGKKREFSFAPKHHVELGTSLGLFDFERAAKISAAQFPMYIGIGAMIEFALIQFMWNENTKKGYVPVLPPYLVNPDSMFSSGNLPKFEDQLYKCRDDELFLIPTAEVPLTNLYRDEILSESVLPLKYTGYTACFRREAGTYGAEERGLIRTHQFNKMELYKYTTQETSYDELESLVNDAEDLLKKLGLHYRVMLLVTGDIGQQSAKTYDIEVWLPGQNRYYEVSSCSNCEDYQARRGNIRYRPKGDGGKEKPRYVHTLNGSGLATSRLLISILENNQQEDGSVIIPEVLRPYMNGMDIIRLTG